jgi:hypothetical protein
LPVLLCSTNKSQGVKQAPYADSYCLILSTSLSAPYSSTKRKGPPVKGGKPMPKTAPMSPSTCQKGNTIFFYRFQSASNRPATHRVGQNAILKAQNSIIDETRSNPHLNIFIAHESLRRYNEPFQNFLSFRTNRPVLALRVFRVHEKSFARFAA